MTHRSRSRSRPQALHLTDHASPRRKACPSPGSPRTILLFAMSLCVAMASAAPNRVGARELSLPADAGRAQAQHLVNVPLALGGEDTERPLHNDDHSMWAKRQFDDPEASTAEDESQAKDDKASSSSASASSATETASASSVESSLSATATATGIVVAANSTSTGSLSLPTPLDSGFGANLTQNCNNFIASLLNDANFQACLPISLLLQNSHSFFQASKSLVSITRVLDRSCSANSDTCATLMSTLASSLGANSACGTDLDDHNAVINSVLLGLRAYSVLYTATCLKDPSSGAYCYAEAITNASNPTDSYLYYLPLNTSLPAGGQPSCGACTKSTMAVFESATANRSSAIADTYADAAMQTNIQCGPGFVSTALSPPQKGLAHSITTGAAWLSQGAMLALLVIMTSWMI